MVGAQVVDTDGGGHWTAASAGPNAAIIEDRWVTGPRRLSSVRPVPCGNKGCRIIVLADARQVVRLRSTQTSGGDCGQKRRGVKITYNSYGVATVIDLWGPARGHRVTVHWGRPNFGSAPAAKTICLPYGKTRRVSSAWARNQLVPGAQYDMVVYYRGTQTLEVEVAPGVTRTLTVPRLPAVYHHQSAANPSVGSAAADFVQVADVGQIERICLHAFPTVNDSMLDLPAKHCVDF